MNANPQMPQMNQLTDTQKIEMLKTGTTTIGIVCDGAVILATESQATAGFFVATKEAQKLYPINEYVGATMAGGVADCQYVIGQVQAISRLEHIQTGKIPKVKKIANIMRNILFNGRSFFYAWHIVGGVEEEEGKWVGKIYPIDFIGYMSEGEQFASLGSGSSFALGVLENGYEEGMSEEEAIALARKALDASRARDAGSGYAVQIVVINKDGLKAIAGPLAEK
ncbi:Proteasome subunit beta [Candidatus Lokiarchaeum ossiferum]|uniref:proteasome endopeptidase complex n=1 Tax=Candidatus Lokiarchaeum ossiferum TaxID=2951803 RepID=A0ABY6HTB1_9ARCH|nr:Proteasome subunit beta [Candidatus Lokiarchaeum sp. B-35]